MRSLPITMTLLVLLVSAANAGPKEDALAVVEKWSKAFTAADTDGILKLYAPDGTFFGTGSKTTVVKPEDIRSYFQNAFLATKWQTAELKSYAATTLSDTTVIVTGLDSLAGTRDGRPVSAEGRITFVVAKRGTDWQIVHFHRSALPN